MAKSLQRAVFSVLGLPQEGDHTITKYSQNEDGDIYTVHNHRRTPYLICRFVKGSSPYKDEPLRDALTSISTVGVAVQLTPEGAVATLLRKNFRTGDFEYIASLEAPSLLSSGYRLAPGSLTPLTNRIENVLFEVHSAFRDVDGLHAPDALDEICKLIYAKLFDEENSLKTKAYIFQRSAYHSVEECAAEIRQLYLTAINEDRAIFVNKIPAYDRSRGVFRDQLMLSSSAIVRAVELLQHYDLSNSPVDIKGRAFQNVLVPSVRSGMGQYFTPKQVIDFIVEIMRPHVRELVIDPFCGSGHFLTSAIEFVRRDHHREDKLFHEFAFTRLHGIEKSDRMVRIAMTDMRLHGDGHSNIRCVDSLLPFSNYTDLYRESFDLVITNPPFGVDLPSDTLSQLGPFTLSSDKKSAVSLEIVALERCLQLLRPGGRMAIVLPESIFSNRNTSHVREWVRRNARIKAIISLPVETFSPFGANISTSILVLRKLGPAERYDDPYGVFLSDVTAIGYDGAGRPTGQNDLAEVANEFNEFRKREGW